MFCPNPECPSKKRSGHPAEYADGVTVCVDCGVELTPEPPEDDIEDREDDAYGGEWDKPEPHPFVKTRAVWGLILVTTLAYFVVRDEHLQEAMRLFEWSPVGLVGHMFVHESFFHLFCNMVFLSVFGPRVCVKFGGLWFVLYYLLFGIVGGALQLVIRHDIGFGASGAIYGLQGLFLVWFPLAVFRLDVGGGIRIPIPAVLLILWGLVFDIWAAAKFTHAYAQWAHLGGFACGVLMGLFAIRLRWVEFYEGERPLVRPPRPPVEDDAAGEGEPIDEMLPANPDLEASKPVGKGTSRARLLIFALLMLIVIIVLVVRRS